MGLRCWIAPRDVNPGINYPTQIVNAIKSSNLMVAIASNNLNKSGHCGNEILLAFDNNKIIIPFFIEDATLSDELQYSLNSKHWIHYDKDFSGSLKKLAETVKNHVMPETVEKSVHTEITWKKVQDTVTKNIDVTAWNRTDEETAALSEMYELLSDYDDDRISQNNFIESVADLVYKSPNDHVLKLAGSPGCGKEKLMQEIYINILNKCENDESKNIVPFMFDLNYYESVVSKEFTESELIKTIEKDFSILRGYLKTNRDAIPLIFINGIRTYDCCGIPSAWVLNGILSSLPKYKSVICYDSKNKFIKRTERMMPFDSNDFEIYISVNPINVLDKEIVNRFGDLYSLAYGYDVKDEINSMISLGFKYLDPFLISSFHPIIKSGSYTNMTSVYDRYCNNFLKGSPHKMSKAASATWDYWYTNELSSPKDVLQSIEWNLLESHNSIQHYLIAKQFMFQIQNFETKTDADYSFFDRVFPKDVNRFTVQMMNISPDIEGKILDLSEKYYDSLGAVGKTLMTYWLGRFNTPSHSREGVRLLLKYRDITKKRISELTQSGDYPYNEQKSDLFLLRGIDVSLIYNGDFDIGNSYVLSLIYDKIANMINRGFHLEYYGDKDRLPNKKNIDFEDDVSVGDRTIRHLLDSAKNKIDKGDYSGFILVLDLFTVSSLLQARREGDNTINIAGYRKSLSPLLDKYIQNIPEYVDPTIVSYFKMIAEDLRKDSQKAPQFKLYNIMQSIKDVKRTGWVNLGIEDPENVAEHMYDCWLIGVTHLPEEYDDPDYSKDKILKMLLIHDIGESIVGDLIPSEKIKNPNSDIEEDNCVRHMFLKGTYPGIPSMYNQYELWDEWHSQKTINALIAMDIDKMQAVVQFCRYYVEKPENYDKETYDYWLSQKTRVKTDIGKEIVDDITSSILYKLGQ